MASRRKRVKAKTRTKKQRTKVRKKTVKRAVAKKTRKAAKKSAPKARRKHVTQRTQVGRRKARAPVVEDTVVDIVDEPSPGVVRVTEIEEVNVAVPDTDEEDEE
jgi:hypothetical protein